MKREELKAIEGLTDAAIDEIMKLHGKDIEGHKTSLSAVESQRDALKGQLDEANKQIGLFKEMDPEKIKQEADSWKQKAEQAEADSKAQLAQIMFDHALDAKLTDAKVKSSKAVKAYLDMNGLKFNETDKSIVGLDEQLSKLKSAEDTSFLFTPDEEPPTITTKTNSTTVTGDKFMDAFKASAGLPEGDKK